MYGVYVCVCSRFPAQNGECYKNVRNKSHSLDDREHGCPILSQPEEPSVHHKEGRSTAATCHESRPVKPSFCISAPHRGLLIGGTTDKLDTQGLASSWDNYPATSTRCFTTTRRSNDPARSRPRRERRHKNHHGHKNEQTSRF